jgi:hypothetical protein
MFLAFFMLANKICVFYMFSLKNFSVTSAVLFFRYLKGCSAKFNSKAHQYEMVYIFLFCAVIYLFYFILF